MIFVGFSLKLKEDACSECFDKIQRKKIIDLELFQTYMNTKDSV